MLHIGVTGWGDHDSIYPSGLQSRDKLKEYGAHFPVVEVDASFYAIQPIRNAEKWVKETPETFRFVVKAYQGMTGHQRGEQPFESLEVMFRVFIESIEPFVQSGKLAMILLQFPPWFECERKNVDYLRFCKKHLGSLPIAIEFRNQSWYSSEMREKTLEFLKEEGWIHTVCDEPQAGKGSIPIVPIATNQEKTLVRLHGRNVHGWTKPPQGDWREVRYLYRYNESELKEWMEILQGLSKESKELYVLFNNNSGGDAADNAKEMINMLGIEYVGLAPKQLGLF